MDNSEIDVDVDDTDDVSDQLVVITPIQKTLTPEYGEGEENPTPLEKEGMNNNADFGYTVYYQEEN
jgi:hypothetical protein